MKATRVAVTMQLRLDDDWRDRLSPCKSCGGTGSWSREVIGDCRDCGGTGNVYDPAVPAVDYVAQRVMAMTFDGPWHLEAIASVRQP